MHILFKTQFQMIILLTTLSLVSLAKKNETCIQAKEFVKYPDGYELGMYQRIHPSGRYILHSSMANNTPVVLMDLNGKDADGNRVAIPISTPMNDEVYPATNNWELISSPNHQDGMRYYALDGLIASKANATPIFSDETHNEFYQSVGELPGSTTTNKKIRVTLFSDRKTKEYNLRLDKGKVVSHTDGKSGNICDNIVKRAPTTQSRGRDRENRRAVQRIEQIEKEYFDLVGEFNSSTRTSEEAQQHYRRLEALRAEYSRLQSRLDYGEQFNLVEFSSPVLSPDATEVAALVSSPNNNGNSTMKIFKIDSNLKCTQVDDLNFQTGKLQFSYPANGKKGQLSFLGSHTLGKQQVEEGIYLYDRDTKKIKRLHSTNDGMLGYSGFTKDGRIIYPACLSGDFSGNGEGMTEQDKKHRSKKNHDFNLDDDQLLESAADQEKMSPPVLAYSSNKCGAYIVDPNQIDNSGKVMDSSPKCISTSGKLINRTESAASSKTDANRNRSTK